MRYLFIVLLLVGCTSASNIPLLESYEVYPIEEAKADEGWTRLERVISTGEPITFVVPSSWFPSGLSDNGNVKIIIDQNSDSSSITIYQE